MTGAPAWQRHVHEVEIWGTVVTFDVRAEQLDEHLGTTLEAAVGFLHDVDGWFSTYKPHTPVSLLRNGLIEEAAAPRIVRDVLAACRTARDLTGGVFDPWSVPGGVDPSGYVKGWAADAAADLFTAAGFPNVCVYAGGDVTCRGQQAPGQPWAVGIQSPYDPMTVIEVVHASDQAVATSGLYERGEHIVDPATRTRRVHYESATVVGADGGLADALATACLIAGPACAAWFADLPDWSVYLVKDGQAQFFGPAFPRS